MLPKCTYLVEHYTKSLNNSRRSRLEQLPKNKEEMYAKREVSPAIFRKAHQQKHSKCILSSTGGNRFEKYRKITVPKNIQKLRKNV